MKTLGILLAAGASRRFGEENKLLAAYRGRPLVLAAAEKLAGAGCDALAAVVSSDRVAALLPGFHVVRVAPGQEMAVSFRAALDLAEETGAGRLLICLGDMPEVPAPFLARLLAHPRSAACRTGTARMPPMLLYAADFARAREGAEGDRGARQFLKALPEADLFPLAESQARDIDRPGDIPPGA